MAEKKKADQWSTRWGLILACIGMAVGTGNIWRFPRVAASQGGGAFVLVVIIGLFLWAIPCMMAEAVWGKVTRMGVIGSFKEMVGRKYTWMGAVVAIISLGIAFYYAVVVGWCVRYFVYAITGVIKPGLDSEALWTAFSTTPGAMVPWHLVTMLAATLIIFKGVAEGLEKISKILIPLLFVMLIILAIRANMLPGSIEGLKFLFQPKWADLLKGRVWLEGITQVAWSTGAGWGLYLTYFVYAKKREDIVLNATTVCFGDTTAAFLAGLAVIPTIFALSPDPQAAVSSGNTGLAFIHLTNLFTVMPGGVFFAITFFLALIFAGFSSLLSMVELGVRLLMDMGWQRHKAAIAAGIGITVLGLPSSWSMSFLDNQDWVWGVGLLFSGLLFSFAAMKIGMQKIWDEHIAPDSDLHAPWMWKLLMLFPLWFVIIFGWWIKQAASWYPDTYMKWLPISEYTFTVGTMLYQWAIVVVLALVMNNWLADKSIVKFEATE
ncbi:MAG: sodium-dependent transporter [Thermovirgaceae bacterium]|nr:sodium-dependent transporter [Thermovirgaceae bacterium]